MVNMRILLLIMDIKLKKYRASTNYFLKKENNSNSLWEITGHISCQSPLKRVIGSWSESLVEITTAISR